MAAVSRAARGASAIAIALLLVAACAGDDSGGGRCGDGRIDRGEACDDGPANSDVAPDACRTDCAAARCGDGVVDGGEACDDGAANGEPGSCRETCVSPACGDGRQDAGEECDWGGANHDTLPGNCRTNCRFPYCGDGVLEGEERCDDGTGNSDVASDACRTTCVPASCGDGALDTGEACDDGDRNDDWTANACRLGCALPACGDRVVDLGEECDDGAPEARDGCTATCALSLPETCGAPDLPLRDLRAVGTPDGNGFVASGRLSGEAGGLEPEVCGGPATEHFYAYPIPVRGDLVAELEAPEGRSPVLALRRSCAFNNLACVERPPSGAPLRLILPDVSPALGAIHLVVDDDAGAPVDYTLRVGVREPLAAGEVCALDGSLGRCDPDADSLGCADPDGDGLGRCVPWVGHGTPCDPAGAADLCRVPDVCRNGWCEAACGDGNRQAWEECDDGNLTDGDGCSSSCRWPAARCEDPVRLDRLWDPAARRAVWADDTSRIDHRSAGTCGAAEGGAAVARFVAPEDGRFGVTLEATYGTGTLTLLEACGGEPLACGERTETGLVRAAADLVAGQELYVVIGTSEPASEGPFTVVVEPVVCGDGTLQGFEECDDGNLEAGDACLPDCTLAGDVCAAPYPLPPAGADGVTGWSGSFRFFEADLAPSCVPYSDRDAVAEFTAPAAGRYSFVARGSSGLVVVSVQTGGCEEGVVEACAVSPTWVAPTVVEAELDAGETAWVFLDARSGGSRLDFSLEVAPLVCGDGRRTLPEACDDGNLTAGDGCDATCGLEPAAEVEPNDVRARAQPVAVGTPLAGTLGPDDLDHLAVELAAGATYAFHVYVGGWETCVVASGRPTLLRLHGPTGEYLEAEDAPGFGLCSRLTYVAPAAGTYFLRIEPRTSAVVDYLFHAAEVTP